MSFFPISHYRPLLIAAVILAAAVRPAIAQEAPKPQGFDSFRLVLSRNVFDPERRAMPSRDAARRTVPQGTVRSSVTLTGTMVTPSKSLAFFGSSRSEYNKVASVNDQVGDFKVLEIAPNEVMLEHAGEKTPLSVGKQLPLAGTEPAPAGTPGAPAAPPEPGAPAAAADPVSPTAAPPSGAPSSKEEILRRMMERRQKEMSR